ncbi:hypothetical protein [Streptosporangium sp. NPDC049304]|uniref:hypothetical protein n=1 Tax=Streptosporangium sp. NPDC049304 TaxID=3154830 RepID=UPI00341228B1
MINVKLPCRAVAEVAAILVLLLAGCTSSKANPHEDERAFAELALSALSVARPDYSFGPAPTSDKTADGLSVTLAAYPIGAFTAEFPGKVPVTVTFDRDSGVTRVSPLPETRLGKVLELLGASKGSVEGMSNSRKLLSNMGRSVEVVAVAELTEPMTEAAVLGEDSVLSQPQRVLLSSEGGQLPLGNSLYCAQKCEGQSYEAAFQEWVATLRPQDRSTLKAFGLDLELLRAASRQGKIHGLIYENYDARTLLEISKNPKVKAMYVADVNLKCASDATALCQSTED